MRWFWSNERREEQAQRHLVREQLQNSLERRQDSLTHLGHSFRRLQDSGESLLAPASTSQAQYLDLQGRPPPQDVMDSFVNRFPYSFPRTTIRGPLSYTPRRVYQYAPLKDGYIRLLSLHPDSSNGSTVLVCSLQHFRLSTLSQHSTHDAILYVWGAPDFTHTLLCDDAGSYLRITPKLCCILLDLHEKVPST
jgi:hypothetical protein